MVVEAFLSSLFGVVFERLASSNLIDYFRRVKLDTLVDKLETILNSINQVLDDAEKKQYENPDMKTWLGDVKHAIYEADQLLDEIATDAPLKKLRVESQPSTSTIFNFIPTFIDPFKSRLKELIQSLDCLAEQKDKLELKKGAWTRNEIGVGSGTLERLPTTYLVDASQIYGRDADKDEMIKFLLSKNGNDNQVPVVSIVGLGGMGKTTFAKLVFNDHVIEEHFELKAWVYVSETSDVVGLTKDILKSFHSSSDNESIFNLLQQRLQQILFGKKYLLVLDDIWNKNEEIIEQLLLPFNHGSSGSKIIVTTRDNEVANVLKSTKLFDLQQLEKNDCWRLFETHAFRGKIVSEYPNFESIGKKIVDKCGGLPLALKTLGQLLRKNFSQHEWMKILETDMWHLSDSDNNINPVLRLSYHNLPSNQKRCFAYCSIFPKGYWFEKGELIQIWMAEGLLKCCGTKKSEEQFGNEILSDLESISFFQQPIANNYFGMHDLVNDLAKSVSGEFCMRIDGAKVQGIHERTRHILCPLQLNCVDKLLEPITELKGLRSLLLEGNRVMSLERNRAKLITNNVQRDLFSSLKCLRMLSFRYCDLSELVDEIGNLKLLRYLDLSYTEITSLPDTICMLYNLQTLLLRDCCELTTLPSNFSKLINLRHLELPYSIKKMPKHIGNLSNLQTLPYFVVEVEKRSDLEELGKLNHLHGTIQINGLSNSYDHVDVILKDKKYLEEILMKFNDRREKVYDSVVESHVSVLEALQPNSNLKRLSIENYFGIMFPNWINGCHLPNLVSVTLQNCGFCSHLPSLGQLPYLKELFISDCTGIKIIGKEFYGNNSTNVPFKSLEVLKFERMNNLEEWFCLEGFPLLKDLSIRFCCKLKRALPQHLPSLQNLEILICKELEASIPKGDNIRVIDVVGCKQILINELSPSLKKLVLSRNQYTKFSQGQNSMNNVIPEEFVLDGFVECPSLDLRCYNSPSTISVAGWPCSSLPFSLHLNTNLHSLCLSDCPKLESFLMGGLPSNLRYLEIHNCPKLIASREEWGLFQLNFLNEFNVSGHDFENVESFPEENLLPPTLEYLNLKHCSKLRSLNYKGLLHLKSLAYLSIYNCPSLERLPEEGLSNSLSRLFITRCPLLGEKYKKEGGERWHTISHIPSVWIDDFEQQK